MEEKFNKLFLSRYDSDLKQTVTVILFRKAISGLLLVKPQYLIKTAGPFLFEHRKEIDDKNLAFFVKYDYSKQMVDWSTIMGGMLGSQIVDGFRDTIVESIAKIKDVDKLAADYRQLLGMYCTFVLEEKKKSN